MVLTIRRAGPTDAWVIMLAVS